MNDGVITLLLLSTEDTDYNFLKIGSLGPEIDTVSNAHTRSCPSKPSFQCSLVLLSSSLSYIVFHSCIPDLLSKSPSYNCRCLMSLITLYATICKMGLIKMSSSYSNFKDK